MSRLTSFVALLLVCLPALAGPPNLGRPATSNEVAAWDTDVRADFKGLPKGAGSVARGMEVWEGKCASCHGTFGESNEVFTPIVGGTSAEDMKSGRVAALRIGGQPHRTTLMKLSTVSTLWDYINRAMPWTEPKSLSTTDVYAVTAYILNMGGIVADDFVLSDANIADVQKRLPNRHGMSQQHGLWSVGGKPDVSSKACMQDCPVGDGVRSSLPLAARNAHGNLAEQQRLIGPTRGTDTTRPAASDDAPASLAAPAAAAPAASVAAAKVTAPAASALALAKSSNCMGCHGVSTRIVGPAFTDIAKKYQGKAVTDALRAKLKNGGSGAFGAIPMPPQSLKDDDAQALIAWILAGAKP